MSEVASTKPSDIGNLLKTVELLLFDVFPLNSSISDFPLLSMSFSFLALPFRISFVREMVGVVLQDCFHHWRKCTSAAFISQKYCCAIHDKDRDVKQFLPS